MKSGIGRSKSIIKKICLGFGLSAAVVLTACGQSKVTVSPNQPTVNSLVTEIDIEGLETQDQVSKDASSQNKVALFLSEKDVCSISDDELLELGKYPLHATDYIEDLTVINDFGIPLLEDKNEYIQVVKNAIEKEADESGRTTEEIACEHMQCLLDSWTTKRPGEEIGSKALDGEMIYCGETEDYIEYSLRYTDQRTLYENNVLQIHDIPRAYRYVYMKNVESNQEDNYSTLYGSLDSETVKRTLDIMLNAAEGTNTVYRIVEEDIQKYVYSIYYIGYTYGDFGLNDEVNLKHVEYTVYKDTGRMEMTGNDTIRSVEVPGTADDSNVVDEGEYPM